jgi:hypothetical protein
MNAVIGLILLFLVIGAIRKFARMDAAAVARAVRHGGGALGMFGAILLLLRGRVGVAAALAGVAASFAGWRGVGPAFTAFRGFAPGAGGAAGARSGRVSIARSPMVEMRLDHDTGSMSGTLLAGAYSGRGLDSLSRPELATLRATLALDDPEGLNLLEAYLDRRFAGWREAEQGQDERRGRDGSGGMSRAEAYEVLGLPEGAAATEIIRAHRSLMKKFHPDHGGSTALAARVNQAKDVLMQRHG